MQILLIQLIFTLISFTGGTGSESEIKVIPPSDEAVPVLHCEVPCGIYGDSLRVALIEEHISTIEKAMGQINDLSKAKGKKVNLNQVVRWVNNKEKHAEEIQHIVSQYFLHQRIKLTDPKDAMKYRKYQRSLELLHQIQVYSMKCKQGTDLDQVNNLKNALHRFEENYFHKHEH